MYNIIKAKNPIDPAYPERYYPLMLHRKVLDGTLYDCFAHSYDREYHGTPPVYIPEAERAPCINTGLNLMRSVVEESASFLWGEDRFPDVIPEDDDEVKNFIAGVKLDAHLVHLMQDATLKGSTGSCAIQVRVLNNRFFLNAHYTEYFTPEFDPLAPDTLVKLTERKKLLGAELAAAGYPIDPLDYRKPYWFMREWDEDNEIWYVPWQQAVDNPPFHKEDKPPVIDRQRSVEHRLGLVPWVWIKNLPNGPNDIDGACTYEPAIENCIQIDYALSRADRALKYNSDPLMVFKVRHPNQLVDLVKSSNNAVVLGVEGDAKVLEISGDAAHAIIDTVNELKDEALHSIHGNRADPDKLATSQSSVAQRMLYLPMVQLASQLRVSYGEGGVVPLIRMMLRIANKMPVKVRGKSVHISNPEVPLSLEWSDFFPPTPADMQTESATIIALFTNGLMSKETALRQLNKFFDFGDLDNEITKIKSDQDEQTKLLEAQSKATAAGKPPSANGSNPVKKPSVSQSSK